MLNHQGTIIIETERLILRRFTMLDVEDVFYNWTSDEDVCKFMRWDKHKSIEETSGQVRSWFLLYNRRNFYQWAITLKNNDHPIGAIGLFVLNDSDKNGDVGYCLSKGFWGHGIITEALKAVIDFAFVTVGFNRIESFHSIDNPSSGRVMQKAGMQYEGCARQKYKSIRGYEDSDMYAILRSDPR